VYALTRRFAAPSPKGGGANQEGFVLVVVAILLVALAGFVALGVDVGALYSARTSAQEIADAAALAGAVTFIHNPTAPQPATASDFALQVALNNSIMGQPITATDVTITVDVANRKVTVDVASTQNTYFAHAIGHDTANIQVSATAEAAEHATGSSCVKPWFVPNTVFATSAICDAACDPNQLLIDPVTKEVTPFAESKIGDEFTLKPQNPTGAIAPGQFYAIQLPDSVGASDYENNIATCANVYVRCNDSYSVETGNMVGPTIHGVEELIGDNPDEWVGPGEYRRPDGTLTDISDSVVVAPVWDSCALSDFCPDGKFPTGTTVSLKIVGFAVFFLKGIEGGDVVARLINVSSCGPASGTPSETGGTVLSLPLRLVRQ
jgi:Flp pilus assembly protein TadG